MLKRTLLLIILSFAIIGAFAQGGTLKGKVTEKDGGAPVPFANISLLQGNSVVTGGMTDFDGNYTIKPVPAGVYTVKVSYVGYATFQMNNLRVTAGKMTFQNFKLSASAELLETVEIVEYTVPLISKDATESGGTVTSEDIARMPGRSAESVASTVGGVFSEDGSVSSIRGSRSEGTVYYIDGMKVRGSNAVPKSALEQVSVITGGLPAKYGDATGGIISITTKGPQRVMFGGAEFVTSHFLDSYNYNLGEIYMSGPMFSKKKVDPNDSTKFIKEPIVGYFFSVSGKYFEDPQMSSIGYWKGKDEVRQDLLANPYVFNDNALITTLNAEYLHDDAFENIKTAQNAQQKSINASGKIDIKPSKNLNITLGGTYNYSDSRIFSNSNTLFNSSNNGQSIYNNWRAYARLTQKFRNLDQEEEDKSASIFKNSFYQIQVDYENTSRTRQDVNHKDDLFNYGYNGKFNTYKINTFEYTDTLTGYPKGVWMQNGFMDTLVTFTPTDQNPDVGMYTENLYDIMAENGATGSFVTMNKTFLQQFGAILNGYSPDPIYGMYNSAGTVYNSYNKFELEQFRVTGSGSTDIGDHEISLGFELEQRSDRFYGASPRGLWVLADQQMNKHISQLDFNHPHYNNDTVFYDRLYNAANQSEFDINFRNYLNGQGEYVDGQLVYADGLQWIDIDSYSPEDFKIDYFSPDELLNDGNPYVSYYGYDVHGKKLTSNPSLNDFFYATYTDANGNQRFKREIAAFQPSYGAFYIQDKFAFRDLIFNVGVRIDRYDANQEVLKDMYLLHDAKNVSDIVNEGLVNQTDIPTGIGDDYIVYITDVNNFNGASDILGYRTGTNPSEVKWFNAQGEEITNYRKIESGTGLAPFLKDPNSLDDMKNTNINAYHDYQPQYVFMPRLSFSFPISDVALFFAHYDVLSQRPSGNNINPLAYMFIDKYSSNVISNPDLKPSKTIDYELGFQQKLSNTSSLKISTFYKEMRDMIQTQKIAGAYPFSYMTYTNIDFGTVKGLSLTYDLRRTGNVSLKLSYTLQFASGTGSNAQSGRALASSDQPNLRTTIPLDFDQRHAITGVLDYRFFSGKLYNGPRWFGMDFFQNTGANFVFRYGTGTPYSRRDPETSYLVGSMNGSRKPGTFTVDLKIDKTIPLTFGKEDNKKEASLNIYLQITNLFNTLNIRNVYSTTGNAEDDGYLTAAINQTTIEGQLDPASYSNYYGMNTDKYWFYYNPRTIRFGVQFNF